VSPADSGSPRAMHRQERLHGPSNDPEQEPPVQEPQAHDRRRVPTPLRDLPVPPDSVPLKPDNDLPRRDNVLRVPPGSVRPSPASGLQGPRASVRPRVPPAW